MPKERMRYDQYARQRIFLKLLELNSEKQGMSWSAMAAKITTWNGGTQFQRITFYRLRDGTLSDENVDIIVRWLVAEHDPDFEEKLHPDHIFKEIGFAARDYYFHIPKSNVLEEWDEQILDAFSGVYLCAPENDRNSFTPLPVLRRWFDDRESVPELERKNRTLDIKQYIGERSYLVLRRTTGGYFHAAEFPTSVFYPDAFGPIDEKMIYEGIGTISSNSILVQLRDCLARVPKTHSLVISRKTDNHLNKPYGLKLFIPWEEHLIRKEWAKMSNDDRRHLAKELSLVIDTDLYLQGATHITSSPLPKVSVSHGLTIARGMVYHQKPADLLQHREHHFIRPDLANVDEIEKIIAAPLFIGELL